MLICLFLCFKYLINFLRNFKYIHHYYSAFSNVFIIIIPQFQIYSSLLSRNFKYIHHYYPALSNIFIIIIPQFQIYSSLLSHNFKYIHHYYPAISNIFIITIPYLLWMFKIYRGVRE